MPQSISNKIIQEKRDLNPIPLVLETNILPLILFSPVDNCGLAIKDD